MELSKISLASVADSDVELVSNVFDMWKTEYTPIVNGAGGELKAESFHRSQFLNVIHDNGEPLSFSLSSFLNVKLRGMYELGYFASLSDELRVRFKVENPRIMTIEWVTVAPMERARISKIRQSDLIMGSSMRFFGASAADVAIGFSRTDLGADRIAAQFGCVPQGLTSVFGIDCQVMMVRQTDLRPHKFAVVQRAIDGLWMPGENQALAA